MDVGTGIVAVGSACVGDGTAACGAEGFARSGRSITGAGIGGAGTDATGGTSSVTAAAVGIPGSSTGEVTTLGDGSTGVTTLDTGSTGVGIDIIGSDDVGVTALAVLRLRAAVGASLGPNDDATNGTRGAGGTKGSLRGGGAGLLVGNGAGMDGVGRRIPGIPDGVVALTDSGRTGATTRGVNDGFVSGVLAPTEIRMIAPHTLHRALTPFGGTLAGSTRKTDRQS